MKTVNSVSIVIPVYNEAAYLPACLDAIAAQTVKPLEVIVVDNNSIDDTASIARSYNFVTLHREKTQGVVHARDRGFNAARGKIIGRIDADTVIDPDWVATVQSIFQDPAIDAVSGSAKYHDMSLSPLMNSIDLLIRTYLARSLGDEVAMQGANMAIRRTVWRSVRSQVCRAGGMHEDFDLAIHTNQNGHRVVFDKSLVATIGARQLESSFESYTKYILLSPRTYGIHGLISRRYMYPVCALALVCYIPLKILHRGYDKEKARFSIASLFELSESRVNPATYGDYN
jgi:glycosyltransferase involved in cell wall biosynthesis